MNPNDFIQLLQNITPEQKKQLAAILAQQGPPPDLEQLKALAAQIMQGGIITGDNSPKLGSLIGG